MLFNCTSNDHIGKIANRMFLIKKNVNDCNTIVYIAK